MKQDFLSKIEMQKKIKQQQMRRNSKEKELQRKEQRLLDRLHQEQEQNAKLRKKIMDIQLMHSHRQ